MLSNLFHDLITGHQYSKKWPVKPQLYAIFPECRIIKAWRVKAPFGVGKKLGDRSKSRVVRDCSSKWEVDFS